MYMRPANLRNGQALAEASRGKQRGVVLLVALIILVALTLAGVALIRSVDTANLIAGNQSFHQAAVYSGERSTEIALTNWLELNNALGNTSLHADSHVDDGSGGGNGYFAARADPGAGVSWDTFWNTTLRAAAVTGATDASGNTVSYVIHRLCDPVSLPAAPHVANCARQPASINTGGSFGAGGVAAVTNNQVYYRITTRIQGPRNTVAYVQTIVAL